MLAATSSRDNWERLVAAVLKREQIWDLCHQDSITTISSSDFSQRILSFSSTSPRHVSSSPSPDRLPLTNDSVDVEDRKNPSETITRKLFSALLWRSKPPKVYDHGEGLVGIPEDHFGVESFSLRELLVATDNFSNKNILGHGGHSRVYKGRLADGSLIAVKRYGAQTIQVKINNELEISSILVAHRNVLHLRGLCFTQKEQLLVYPYMENGSVASWLRGRSESQAPLNWAIRQWIALGVAKGLAYMHHECVRGIIHDDIKAANILLDDGFEAVVADFSLAIFYDGYNTGVYGTSGHIDPEYLATGKCLNKSDVYDYGIFLLELVTGQVACDFRLANDEGLMLLDWVMKLYNKKSLKVMVDQDVEGNFFEEDMEKLLEIALMCTRSDPEGRPMMPEVVRMLEHGDGLAERGQDLSQNVCESDQNYYPGEGLVGIPDDYFGVESFSLHELLVATNHFSNKNILGRGGNCTIYKGRLVDGSLAAIKRFRAQTDQVMINNELEISSSLVAHRNVLHLGGICFTQTEQLFVYPYMANGSVASWLRERSESQAPLNWVIRQRISLGVAKGVAYMHHECVRGIIHRDIKAANILLDDGFEAVVADFSLAKFDDGYNTGVYGTTGHIAPEYLATSKCSAKTDVYGYGIFLLELVTGKRAFDPARVANYEDLMLLDWVWKLFNRKSFKVIVDQDLEGNFVEEDMEKLFQIALICTRSDPEGRPTMPEVVRMLEDGDGLAERGQDLYQNVCESDQNYYPGEGLVGIPDIWTPDEVAHMFSIVVEENHFGVESFSLHELLVATNHFSKWNIRGRGGHSTVYKGWLADGSVVAIKRFRAQTGQVMINNELEISSSLVALSNVLSLRGLCFTQKEQLLVYPYMANGSVASFIKERSKSKSPLYGVIRQRIALGAAKGLAYMHHECLRGIIHRDIKAANILLDEGFEAVVADFSLAKFDDGYITRVSGTPGHIAPEYFATGKCSNKTDVYGYGIFLLELVTGKRAFDPGRVTNYEDPMLLDWARKLFSRESLDDLEGNFDEEDVEKLLQIALICAENDPGRRPTMPEVVRMLEDGGGLGERWQDLSLNVCENDQSYYTEWIIASDASADELSGPR